MLLRTADTQAVKLRWSGRARKAEGRWGSYRRLRDELTRPQSARCHENAQDEREPRKVERRCFLGGSGKLVVSGPYLDNECVLSRIMLDNFYSGADILKLKGLT